MNRRAALLILFLAALPVPAHAMFCPGGVVSEGDRKIEVLARCGEPDWRDERVEETAEQIVRPRRGRDGGRDRSILDELREASVVEEWTYNFGGHRLLHFLTFRHGRLVHVETGGYGFSGRAATVPDVRCWSESMARGRRKLEVVHHCGEPTTVDERRVERTRRVRNRATGKAFERREIVWVEEWTYNFGPHRLLYVFTLEDGKVVSVRTAGYGF